MTSLQRTSRSPRRAPRARAALIGSLTVLVLGGATACSSSSDEHAYSGSESGDSAGKAAPSAESDTGRQALSKGAPGTVDALNPAADSAAGGNAASPVEEQSSTREPAIISTATVSLESEDADATRQDVQRLVDQVKGKVTESSSEADEDGETNYVRMVLRVPAASFDKVLVGLEGVATQTASMTESSDVTTEVIDVESRLATQKASVERIRQLLAKASTIKDIAWLESELSNRQATLDSLTQQQAYLADQTSLSTITVDITDPASRTDSDDNAFVAGLKDGWNAFTESVAGVVTVVGALLPFAVLLGLIAWIGRLVWRRRRPTAPAPAAAQTAVVVEKNAEDA